MQRKPFEDGRWRDVDALPAPLRRKHDAQERAARKAREAEQESRWAKVRHANRRRKGER